MGPSPDRTSSARFPTTRWSRVVAAGGCATPDGREALAELCRAYWYPLYVFIRRKGFQPDDAQDLTQAARVMPPKADGEPTLRLKSISSQGLDVVQ
jgi:hypothetical protein